MTFGAYVIFLDPPCARSVSEDALTEALFTMVGPLAYGFILFTSVGSCFSFAWMRGLRAQLWPQVRVRGKDRSARHLPPGRCLAGGIVHQHTVHTRS